jgi:hypothetical protein
LARHRIQSNLRVFETVFRSPKYLALALGGVIVYYFVFNYLVSLNNIGIVINSGPVYFVYLLAITASVLLTLTAYSVSLRLRSGLRKASPMGFVATITPIIGGGVTGCACQAPILYNLLYFVGLNSFEASGFVTLVAAYALEIDAALILLNLVAAYAVLSKISRALEA